jgi:hypothetical protein
VSIADLLADLRATFPAGQTSGTFEAPGVQGGEYVPLLTGLGIPTTLALTSPEGWVEQDSGVGLSGTLTTQALGVSNVPVQFTFAVSGQDFDLTMALTLPATWHFSQSFPSLAGGVYDELDLASGEPSALSVASVAPALSFSGTFATNSSVITMLAWLIDDGAPLTVSGPVGYDAQHGTVDMTLALATGSIDDLFGESGPTLDFRLALWSGLDAAVNQYSAGVQLETSLDFGETVDLEALLIGSDQGVLDITLSGSALAFPDPATLEQYFGSGNGIADALPDKFQGGTLVQVDEITFGIGLTTHSLEYAFLTVGALTGQTWPLWPPDVIELGDIEFEFHIFKPLDPDNVVSSFTFSALLTLGDTVPLLVRAELPGDVISAGLDRTQPPPNLTPYVQHAFGDAFGLPEELLISKFDLSADLGTEPSYGGRLELEGEWEFAFGTGNTLVFEDLLIDVDYTSAGASGDVAARFAVDENEFLVAFAMTKGNTQITGAWHEKRKPLTYQDIAIALGMYGLPNLPTELDLELTEACFEFDSSGPSFVFEIDTKSGGGAALVAGKDATGKDWGFIFGMILSLDVSVDLTDIPVIGKLIPSGYDTFALSDLRVVGATTVLPVYTATEHQKQHLEQIIGPTVNSGLVLSVQVEIGTAVNLPLSVRFGGADDGSSSDTPPGTTALVAATAGNGGASPGPQATWVTVQRAFGPVQFNRVGFAITPDDEVALLLDASVSLAGLTIGLVGLEAAMPLQTPFTPSFDLAGLQVGFNGGAVQISGGLEKVPDKSPLEFTGELVVEIASFGLSVLGSYTTVDGQPSLFVFLFLDAPLGGPPFFFVTGLAGGFGYNRSLQLPTIDEVATFPLVAGAMGQLDAATTLDQLNERIQPDLGEDWLAAGVRFTSFETLQSFALLTVAFGNQFEVALIGESTISVPPAAEGETVTPTAQAQMVILVDYAPAQGQLAVCAQLTPASYLLEKAAQLTGGFAFYLWFPPSPHAGDFVVTLGGYNPYFTPPSHYPKVPRLGLDWKVSDQLTIAGGLYFALTPSVLMAGGELEATWQSGDLSASFVAYADFLMRFKPFQYQIDVGVSISVSLTLDLLVTTKRITIHVSVAVDIWGPQFGGVARIDLSIVSFTVGFGAGPPGALPDLKWPEFRSSFLPAASTTERSEVPRAPQAIGAPTPTDSIVTLTAPQGLVSAAQPIWLVDPTKLQLNVATQVPSSDASVVTATTSKPTGSWNTQLGVGPMGVAPGGLSSVLTIEIQRDGVGDKDVWTAVADTGGVPSGLWQHTTDQMETDGLVHDALNGVALTPTPPVPDQTLPVPRYALAAAEPAVRTFAWSPTTVPDTDPFDQQTAMTTLQSSLVDEGATRTGLLEALRAQGLQTAETVDVAGFAANAPNLLASPPLLRYLGEDVPA